MLSWRSGTGTVGTDADRPLMPRTLTLSSLVASLVLAVAAVLTTEPWSGSAPSGCAFEVRVESDESGLVQLYFDSGRGINEADSVVQPVQAGKPAVLRFGLPRGHYRALRLDPLDRDARMTLSGARIADRSGTTLVSFAPGKFEASFDIASLGVQDGKLRVETKPRATDPQLSVRLAAPFTLSGPPLWRELAGAFAAILGFLILAGWAGASKGVRLGERLRLLWVWAGTRPGFALAAASLLGVMAANYPVIFAGKSFVSPNLGVPLLYGQNPWLPGFPSGPTGDAHKADLGALLWHHVPLSMIEHRAVVQDGELPLWNRYDSAGSPLLGQGQSCFGDPLHLLPVLADGAAWAWDLKFLLARWAFALGIGLCAWRAFRHLPTALILAVSASFMGFFVYRICHPAIFSLCYSPWILLCWLRLSEARTRRSGVLWLAALIGANWVEMNSGTVKEAYVLLLSINFSGLCVMLSCARPLRERLAIAAGSIAAGVLFAMIASPVWYTFYRALGAAYTSYGDTVTFQIQPGMLIGLFDEAFYRPFQFESGVINPSANFFVLIGLLWLVVRWRTLLGNRTAAALLFSGLPALALVFGVIPPGLVARVPFLGNIMHVDNTFSCVLIVVFLVLSALGWREAWEQLGSAEGRRDGAAVVALVFLIYAAYLGTSQSIVRSVYGAATWGKVISVAPFIHAYGWSLVLGAAVFLAALHRARRRGAASAAVLVCLVLGFGAFHWRSAMRLGTGFAEFTVRPERRPDFHAHSPAVDSVAEQSEVPFRVVGFHNDVHPGWSAAYGLEGISGPDALINPYYRQFMEASGVSRVWDWRYIVEPGEVAKLRPVFDLLNVRFYLGYRLGPARPGSELRQVDSSDMDVYESPTKWPRAFFTDGAAVYDELPQFCSWLKFGDGRPFVAVQHGDWVKLSPVPRVQGDLAKRQVAEAENYHSTADTTSFTVTAPGPGFIVLTEAYERDNFQATLNGKRVPYIRVNHAFKGIYVDEAGTYEVSFSYWPKGLSATLLVSGLGIAVLALVLFVELRRSGPAQAVART